MVDLEIGVADNFAFNQIDDLFGDIGGMIGNAFKVTSNPQHVDKMFDLLGGIFNKVGALVVNFVDIN